MRIEICYEDAIQYQWFIVKGALQLPEEVPLTLGYNFSQDFPIGKVRDIRREDDGAVTGEMFFFKPASPQAADVAVEREAHILEGLEKGWYDGSMYANEVTDERIEDLRIVHRASLKAVVIVPVPTFQRDTGDEAK